MKRRNRTVTPGGTITDLVYDARGHIIGAYIGTNDDGATETDPTGGGVDPENNMVIVTGNEFDGGAAGGDGNLTQVTQYVDSTTTRVTSMTYDFRDRKITTDGEVDYFQMLYYDNLDRVVETQRYDTTSSGNLILQSATNFDDRNRIYQTINYGVDPTTGDIGNALTDNTWFDESRNTIMSLPAGSSLYTKTTFDSLGRATVQYRGYNLGTMSYADAFSVVNDVVMEQVETTYDEANNVIQTTLRQRYHNAPNTQTGELHDPGTTPKARVTYQTMYPDSVNRPVAAVNYGTNGGSALSRPDTISAASDTVLVSQTLFDLAGNVMETIDSAGMVTSSGDVFRVTTSDTNLHIEIIGSRNMSSGSGVLSFDGQTYSGSFRAVFTSDPLRAKRVSRMKVFQVDSVTLRLTADAITWDTYGNETGRSTISCRIIKS
jgi:hypothetical protein